MSSIYPLAGNPLGLHVNDKGRLLNNINNVLVLLRSDPSLNGLLAYDEMAQIGVMRAPLGSGSARTGYPRPLTDADYTDIHELLQDLGLRNVSLATARQGVDRVTRDLSYHPVRDWLAGLHWDGDNYAENWLPECLGTDNDPYHRAIGRMFITAMAARILEPGCQADYMLVLEGDQGILKSRACKTLADPWFSDQLPDINSKDASVHLRGLWLIEVAEMHKFDKADTLLLKSYVTRRQERYRPPFAHADVIEPRQCLFVGTTNKDTYLKDETGGRRFWPVRCGVINIAKLEHWRSQLFAEAVYLFENKVPYWPDRDFEKTYIAPQQEARYDGDVWEEPISDFLQTQLGPVTLMQVARTIFPAEISRLNVTDQNRIKKILAALGWERARRQGGTGKTLFDRKPKTVP